MAYSTKKKAAEYKRLWSEKNRDRLRAYWMRYYLKRRDNDEDRAKRLVRSRLKYKRNAVAERARLAKQRLAHADRYSARYAVRRAIRRGELVRLPCVSCGDSASQAHHDDYSKPLDVRWLCRRCHGVEHRKV